MNLPDPERRIFHPPGLGSHIRIERLSCAPSLALVIARLGMSMASGRPEAPPAVIQGYLDLIAVLEDVLAEERRKNREIEKNRRNEHARDNKHKSGS